VKPVPKKKDDGWASHRWRGGADRDRHERGRGADRRSRARTWAWGQVVEKDRWHRLDRRVGTCGWRRIGAVGLTGGQAQAGGGPVGGHRWASDRVGWGGGGDRSGRNT
jgi:hypothetical protein